MILRNILLGLGVLALLAGSVMGFLWLHEPSAQQVADQQQTVARQGILVAARPISTGTLLTASDMRWKEIPVDDVVADQIQRGRASDLDFVGAVARRGFQAGDPLIEAELVKPTQGGFLAAVLAPSMRAVSITVGAAESVSGLVAPGDRVDVVLTQNFAAGNTMAAHKSAGETILLDVRVIAVDQALSGAIQSRQPDTRPLSSDARIPRTVTLEVTERQVERLLVAADIGKLELSMRPFAPATASTSALSGPTVAPQGPPTWASDVSSALRNPSQLPAAVNPPGGSGPKPGFAPGIAIMRGSKTERLCPNADGLAACSGNEFLIAPSAAPVSQEARSP
jgi:pilus assembly protein CpaB